MCHSHYDLKVNPFQLTVDERFLWLGNKHAEALATLKYGILVSSGFLVLTGNVGTGKTTLIKRLVKMIDVAAIVATIPDPNLEGLDFFNILSAEFKMNRKFESKGAFLIHFRKFLYGAAASHKKVLLIIDEAQRLNSELLEQIRLLSNIELDNRKLISIFFVGQSEFNNLLREERNRAFRQRITVQYHLEPLTAEETHRYIQHRLKVAGGKNNIFSLDAIREIYSFSRGYPRLINSLCDLALFSGYMANRNKVDVEMIKESVKKLHILTEIRKNERHKITMQKYINWLIYSGWKKYQPLIKRIGIFAPARGAL